MQILVTNSDKGGREVGRNGDILASQKSTAYFTIVISIFKKCTVLTLVLLWERKSYDVNNSCSSIFFAIVHVQIVHTEKMFVTIWLVTRGVREVY